MTSSPATPSTPSPRLGASGRALVVCLWAGLGLLESAKAYLGRRMAGADPDLLSVMMGNLPWWLAWAAFTPLVLRMARSYRFEDHPARAAAAHSVAAVGISLLHHVLVGGLFYLTTTRGATLPVGGRLVEMTPLRQVQVFFTTYFLLNVLTYAAVLSAYLGLEFYRRYRAGEVRAARMEAGMHLARLEALRMELGPHFLFNALNAVGGLVRGGENAAAVEMLSRLGELLRTTLARDADIETDVERELHLLRTYLDIEEVRFGDRLTVAFHVDEETRRAAVPPLLLQPLAENAIKHGIARRPGPGRVTVTSRSEDDVLVLRVADSGPGAGADDSAEDGEPGIGLTNVRRRLQELYGDSAGLTLERSPDGGTVATVRLPLGRPHPGRLRSSAATGNPGRSD